MRKLPQFITRASSRRISALYVEAIGYDPIAEGCTPQEAVQTLREYRLEVIAHACTSQELDAR